MADYMTSSCRSGKWIVEAPELSSHGVAPEHRPERTIIHLANRTHSAHDMPRVHEIPALREIRVELESPCPAPRVTCRGAAATVMLEKKRLIVRIDRLEVYAAVVVEPAEKA